MVKMREFGAKVFSLNSIFGADESVASCGVAFVILPSKSSANGIL